MIIFMILYLRFALYYKRNSVDAFVFVMIDCGPPIWLIAHLVVPVLLQNNYCILVMVVFG